MKRLNKLKIQLIVSAAMCLITATAVLTSTYAWYVMNNTVTAHTSTISATTNGFILQIATREQGAQHGGNDISLIASNEGHKISPSSTNDAKDWYISAGWNGEGKVTSYIKANVSDSGAYQAGGEDHYAYIVSDYILYTILETGLADIYLDASEGSPITVTAVGTPTSDTVPASLRVGIATADINGDNETLRLVYAPAEVTGSGNDAQAIKDKWTYINVDRPAEATYSHIYDTTYVDQNGENWASIKEGSSFVAPSENGQKVAANVGYDGILVRVYIWMEGTDADCVNNNAAEDAATYSVTLKFAGVTPTTP